MKNNKKSKLKFILFALSFVFVFSFSFIFSNNSVVYADSISNSEQLENSIYLTPELANFIDDASAASTRSFDIFQVYKEPEKFITDELLVLYDIDFKPLDEFGSIITSLSFNTYNPVSNIEARASFSLITNVNSYIPYSTIGINSVNGSNDPATNNYSYLSYNLKPKLTTLPDNFNTWIGSVFYFDSDFLTGFQYENISDFYDSSTYAPMYYDNSTKSYRSLLEYFYYTDVSQLTFADVSRYISFKFVPLSDVVVYAYTHGFNSGVFSTSVNGSFSNGSFDVEMTFYNEDDRNDVFSYTLENQKLVMDSGFTDFSSLGKYELVYNVNGVPVPYTGDLNQDVYYWDIGTITISLGTPVYYNSDYFGAYSFSPLAGIDFYLRQASGDFMWTGSDINSFGRFPVPKDNKGFDILGNVYKIRFGSDFRAADILPYVEFKDYGATNSDSFNSGYIEGRADGYDEGFSDGRSNGMSVGFNKGYQRGLEENNSFYSLFSAVIDVPVKAFSGMFNFEILGVNLLSFFYSLLTILIILSVVKFFL